MGDSILLTRARTWWENRRLPRLERTHFRFGFKGCEVLIASFHRSGELWWGAVAVPYARGESDPALLKRLRTEWHYLGAACEFEELDIESGEVQTVFIIVCDRIMDRMPNTPCQLQGAQYRSLWYVAEETKRTILGLSHAQEPRGPLG